MKAKLVTNPKTKPPDADKPYVAVEVDGKEKWFLVTDDKADGVTDADFDFAKGEAWAKKERAKEKAAEQKAKDAEK